MKINTSVWKLTCLSLEETFRVLVAGGIQFTYSKETTWFKKHYTIEGSKEDLYVVELILERYYGLGIEEIL